MISRLAIAAMVAATTLVTATGCAVERHQETVGAYVDDSAVTTKVKAKFAEDPTVSAMAIKVDTMKGVVQLSGFAKSGEERMMAERLARDTNGVAGVRNDIIVRVTPTRRRATRAAATERNAPRSRGIFLGAASRGAWDRIAQRRGRGRAGAPGGRQRSVLHALRRRVAQADRDAAGPEHHAAGAGQGDGADVALRHPALVERGGVRGGVCCWRRWKSWLTSWGIPALTANGEPGRGVTGCSRAIPRNAARTAMPKRPTIASSRSKARRRAWIAARSSPTSRWNSSAKPTAAGAGTPARREAARAAGHRAWTRRRCCRSSRPWRPPPTSPCTPTPSATPPAATS